MASVIRIQSVFALAVLILGGNLLAAEARPALGTIPLAGETVTDSGYSSDELEDLIAPIALYPDDLLAQMFAASAFPEQLNAAKSWVAQNPGTDAKARISNQPWDASVKIVASLDDVLAMMTDYPQWRESLAWAVANQQPALMDAVQAMRRQARDVGNLASTPQMDVKEDRSIIVIQSPDPQIIYVPQYDPAVVYVQRPVNYVAPIITYGNGYRYGWFDTGRYDRYNFNWWGGGIYYGRWQPGWGGNYWGRPWRPPLSPWQPPPRPYPGIWRPGWGGTAPRPPGMRPPGYPAYPGPRPPGWRPPPDRGGIRPPGGGPGSPGRPGKDEMTIQPYPMPPNNGRRPVPRPAPQPSPGPGNPSRPNRPGRSGGSSNPSGGGGNGMRRGDPSDTRSAEDRGAASRNRSRNGN